MHLLEVGAKRLFEVYGQAFVDILLLLKTKFCPSFRAHIDIAIAQEPQNKRQYLSDEDDTGTRETKTQFEQLRRLVDELLE